MVLELKVREDGLSRESLFLDRAALARLTTLRPTQVHIHRAASTERGRTEAFLESAYAEAFGGRVTAHYPVLLSIRQESGAILAAVGYRAAGVGPLFLEQYLDGAIESLMPDRPARMAIAEIGNLASASLSGSLFIILAMMDHLDRAGCSHAAVTATSQLAATFRRLGFAFDSLAAADPGRLPDAGAAWGRYYDNDPTVIAGALGRRSTPLGRLILSGPAAEAVERAA